MEEQQTATNPVNPQSQDVTWPARAFVAGIIVVSSGSMIAVDQLEKILFEAFISLLIGIAMIVWGYRRLRNVDESGMPVMRLIAKNAFVAILLTFAINAVVYLLVSAIFGSN